MRIPCTRRRSRERGATLIFMAAGMTMLFLLFSLAIDLGIGWVARSRLNKAADAAALVAVKYASQGNTAMEAAATAIGTANKPGATFVTTITSGANDVTVVRVEARANVPTLFGKLAGINNFNVAAAAEVTRFPLDMSLVLDISSSMARTNSVDTMKSAAKTFLGLFDEERDQIGIVAFATTAFEVTSIQKHFKTAGTAAIDGLATYPDTNLSHGMQLGHQQLLSAPVRGGGGGRRVVLVLFTDGRPTAFTATFQNIQQPDCGGESGPASYTGALSAFLFGFPLRALSEPDSAGNTRRIACFVSGAPTLVTNPVPPPTSPYPDMLPDGTAPTGDNVRAYARQVLLTESWATRSDHATIYTIGLGDPHPTYVEDTPDETLLRQVANEGGMSDAGQPQGQMFFAPDQTALELMFQQVAARILTRVTM
jgi:Mg-chelatase subunit ChlD